MRMKFYCSTKKFEGKHEAHAIASKLERAAFLCVARLSDEDQDDPDKVKAALKKEFDKETVDHEKAVEELRRLKRKNGETPAQLAWRIEKLMAKAYPELCGSKDAAAKRTHLQMLQDKEMSQRLKRACPQKSNIPRLRLKIRFCSNFVQVYCIISQNALQSFLSKIYFCFEENAIYIGPPEIR